MAPRLWRGGPFSAVAEAALRPSRASMSAMGVIPVMGSVEKDQP